MSYKVVRPFIVSLKRQKELTIHLNDQTSFNSFPRMEKHLKVKLTGSWTKAKKKTVDACWEINAYI